MISACLLGLRTRYDGASCAHARALALARTGPVLVICPEVMGGLPTPRPPAEITNSSDDNDCNGGNGADVLDGRCGVKRANGEDVTEAFLRGTEVVAEMARRCDVRYAIMKDKSPACGPCHIKRDGKTVVGRGVCAAKLAHMGIHIEAL